MRIHTCAGTNIDTHDSTTRLHLHNARVSALLERERARKHEGGMTTSIAGCLVKVRRDHGSRRPLSCCQRVRDGIACGFGSGAPDDAIGPPTPHEG
eukprot:scaffold34794_cov34-Phaeocystis_antarctica.AAC.1